MRVGVEATWNTLLPTALISNLVLLLPSEFALDPAQPRFQGGEIARRAGALQDARLWLGC
jgi:hypothetical protein